MSQEPDEQKQPKEIKKPQGPEALYKAAQKTGVPVSRILLHQAATVGHVTEHSLYRHKGFNMFYMPEGIYGEVKGQYFIVPLPNVIMAYL
jgi:hypothetical protein